MDKAVFSQLIQQTSDLSDDQGEALEELISQYPYFAIVHILIAKYQYNRKSMLAEQKIRKAAAYSYDRIALKNILGITSDPAERQDTLESAKSFLSNVKQEMEEFDKKMESATTEELDKELASITESYIQPKEYTVEDTTEEEAIEKSEAQKEQNALIDQFLEEDIKFEPVSNEEEELPVEDNESEQETQQEVVSEEIEESSSNFFDETLHQLTEEEDTSSPIVEEETEEASITEIEETPTVEEEVFTSTPIPTESEEEKTPIEVTETDAIILFNEGKLQEALDVYKKLIAHYPDKTSYYTTQMEIMGLDVQQEDIQQADLQQEDTPKEAVVEEPEDTILEKQEEPEEVVETIGFTPDLEMPEVNQEESTEEETVADVEFNPAQLVEVTDKKKKQAVPQSAEEYTELDAMSMFNEGRTEEAIEIYHKLMLQHPEKKAYFEAQINILES
ncbi:MAG: tetratricopeptide repeat protein [Thermonemataceae bacterium]